MGREEHGKVPVLEVEVDWVVLIISWRTVLTVSLQLLVRPTHKKLIMINVNICQFYTHVAERSSRQTVRYSTRTSNGTFSFQTFLPQLSCARFNLFIECFHQSRLAVRDRELDLVKCEDRQKVWHRECIGIETRL